MPATTKMWLALSFPRQQEIMFVSGDITGLLFVDEASEYASATCFTPLLDIWTAIDFLGCQRGNDLSAAEVGLFPKQHTCGCVLVLMLKILGVKLKLSFDPHDLNGVYGIGRARSSVSFQWLDYISHHCLTMTIFLSSLVFLVPFLLVIEAFLRKAWL